MRRGVSATSNAARCWPPTASASTPKPRAAQAASTGLGDERRVLGAAVDEAAAALAAADEATSAASAEATAAADAAAEASTSLRQVTAERAALSADRDHAAASLSRAA